jgi:hypothetical protein
MLYDGYEFASYAEAHDQLAELTRRAAEVEPATESDWFIAAALMAWGSGSRVTTRAGRCWPQKRSSGRSASTTRAA